MNLEIAPLDVDDDALVAQVVGLMNAVRAADSPWTHPSTANEVRGDVRYGWELDPARHDVAIVDGRVVARASVVVTEWDNRDLAWLDLTVHPAHRRQGLGTEVLAFLVDEAERSGRTKLGIDGWDDEAPRGFAERFGFTLGSQSINRRQHLDELSYDDVRRRYDEARAHASAYELLRIAGRTPEELLPAVSEMWVAINDAPLDDLDIEDEVFPPQRIRDYETATLQRGQRLYRVIARHRQSGELAGHTVVAVEEERPWIGAQHDTSVVRAPRSPARAAAQGRHEPLAGRGRARAPHDRHLERGVQRPHDRGQRAPGLPVDGTRAGVPEHRRTGPRGAGRQGRVRSG